MAASITKTWMAPKRPYFLYQNRWISLAIGSMVVRSRLRGLRPTEIAICRLIRRQSRDMRANRSTPWRSASKREWNRRSTCIRSHSCRRSAHRLRLAPTLLKAITAVSHPWWSIDSTTWHLRTWASLTTSRVGFRHSSSPKVITTRAYKMHKKRTTISASQGHVHQSEALTGRGLGTKWKICPL